MDQAHGTTLDLIAPYIANPYLIMAGGAGGKKVMEAGTMIGVLKANPGLDLSGVLYEGKPLIHCFMDRLFALDLYFGDRHELTEDMNQLGLLLINEHGCNPWQPEIRDSIETINAISSMVGPPLDFIRGIINHRMAPSIAQIEQAARGFEDNHYSHYRKTGPLHHAVLQNRLDLVDFCLDAGFDVKARDSDGNRPIALAESPEVVRRLLEAGSPITHADSSGEGLMNVWRSRMSASMKEQIGKEIARAIEEGIIATDRELILGELILDMAMNDPPRRKLEEIMQSSGIGWWDKDENGQSIALQAITDMLVRYDGEPKFVQNRMQGLVMSAHQAAVKGGIDLDGLDRELLRVAVVMMGIEKIKVDKDISNNDTQTIFRQVMERHTGTIDVLVFHAHRWHSRGLMAPSNSLDLMKSMVNWLKKSNDLQLKDPSITFRDPKAPLGGFVHHTLPDMVRQLDAVEQARAIPLMIVLSLNRMGQAGKMKFGHTPIIPGGIAQCLMEMDGDTLAPHLDPRAIGEAIKLTNDHPNAFTAAGEEFAATLSARLMQAMTQRPREEASRVSRAPKRL